MELQKELSQKIFKLQKSRSGKHVLGKKKIGMMVAGVHPEIGEVVVGFSLCHKYDEFDRVGCKKVPGHGKIVAINRAVRWGDTFNVNVPPSIQKDVFKFLLRCKSYYKDKNMPPWTEKLLYKELLHE
jgi:hypothetical protein